MSSTRLSPSPFRDAPSSRRRDPHARCPAPSRNHPRGAQATPHTPLARYLDADGRRRELLVLPGHEGSALVLDRDATTLRDGRLVAHLAADEPYENAAIVCRHYLDDEGGRWCRLIEPEDLQNAPFSRPRLDHPDGDREIQAHLEGPDGTAYRIQLLPDECPTAQLHWCRQTAHADEAWEPVRLREVVAALESYEPTRALTERSIELYSGVPGSPNARLRQEFERLCASPIVLNRGLREAVLHAIEHRGVSMSEIALRCGVVKRDRRGNISGETSWLARRIGVMSEGGRGTTTPWIHSDVLAIIARKGLGVSPREVELP
jgi:hypothetical protein